MRLPDVRLILTISCREASRLASESLDRDLTFSERLAIRMHGLICRSCRRCYRQLQLVRSLLSNMQDPWRGQWKRSVLRLSADRRGRIKQLLADAQRAESG